MHVFSTSCLYGPNFSLKDSEFVIIIEYEALGLIILPKTQIFNVLVIFPSLIYRERKMPTKHQHFTCKFYLKPELFLPLEEKTRRVWQRVESSINLSVKSFFNNYFYHFEFPFSLSFLDFSAQFLFVCLFIQF